MRHGRPSPLRARLRAVALRLRRGAARACLPLPLLAASAVPAAGQEASSAACGAPAGDGWDDARATRLAAEVVEARRHAVPDSSLQAFEARAEGHVRLLASFGSGGREQLVRADQVALEVRWQRGVGWRQTIVGRRHEERFPTRIHYHRDHLILVLDDYGDRIEVGEGEEVRGVPHPLGPRGPETYHYRLVDSLEIHVRHEKIHLLRLEVRPRCPGEPGAVGVLDIHRDTRALARMAVTFTSASYVDPTVEQVSVELENGYVERRAWLPMRQRVEIRRRLRWLDLPFGGTIRTSFRAFDYDLGPRAAGWIDPGERVGRIPSGELERFAGWRSSLVAGAPDEVPADSARLEEVRRRARAMLTGRFLGGSAPLRPWLPDVSSGVRIRRADGLFLGMGLRWEPDARHRLQARVGYPFGRQRPEGQVALLRDLGAVRLELELSARVVDDIGPFPAAAGALASGGALLRGEDFRDPFLRDGASAAVHLPVAGGSASLAAGWQRHRSATLELDPAGDVRPRPIRPVERGEEWALGAGWSRELGPALGDRWFLGVEGRAAGGDFEYSRWVVTLEAQPLAVSRWEWELRAGAALLTGEPPPQRLLLLGGRGTVSGWAFRGWAGDRAAFARVGVTRRVWNPWLGLRLVGGAGWTGLGTAGEVAAARLGLGDSGRIRLAAGGGLSLLWDVLRVEAVRGIDGGRWEWMVSVNPRFHAPL